MHGVLVTCRLIGRLDMTITVDWDVKPQTKQINESSSSLGVQAVKTQATQSCMGLRCSHIDGGILLLAYLTGMSVLHRRNMFLENLKNSVSCLKDFQ